jgi:hypothetical protein
MKLTPENIKKKRGKNFVDYVPLATAYNTSMHEKFQSDPFYVPFLGLRMKSPVHIKDFFDLIDKGLAIGKCSTSSRSPSP